MLDTKIPARWMNVIILTVVVALTLSFFGVVELFALALSSNRDRLELLQTFTAILYFPVRQPVLALTQNQILATILQVLWWLALWLSAALPMLKKARSPLAIVAYSCVIGGILLYYVIV